MSKSLDYQIRLNQTEDQLSEKSSELKVYQEDKAKLKSSCGKLVENIEQLKKKSIEVIKIHQEEKVKLESHYGKLVEQLKKKSLEVIINTYMATCLYS